MKNQNQIKEYVRKYREEEYDKNKNEEMKMKELKSK